MAISHQHLKLEDPFLHNYKPSELRIASEFLTTWLPFLSRDLCRDCTQLLSDRIRALDPAVRSDENSSSAPPPIEEDMHDSNGNQDEACDANSLGSWKDEAEMNSLGSWKDGINEGNEADGVPETSSSEPSFKLNATKTSGPRMSWADMTQEDELEEEEDECETEKRLVNVSAGKLIISKVIEKPKLSIEQREYIRFMNVGRKKDFICLERFKGKFVNILEGLELHTGIFSAAEQKRIVDHIYALQEMGMKGELRGCTNNNYASREKCKKCGQPKEIAAMPAIAIPGASFPTYSHYFARTQGGLDTKMNLGLIGNGTSQQLHPLSSNWSLGGADKYGIHAAPTFSLGGNNSAISYMSSPNQILSVPKGWRNGDWICNCGFHNYSSRAQCKKCNASPQALGMKRLASEELVHQWDNKRLNIGQTNEQQQSYPGFEQMIGSSGDPNVGLYNSYPHESSGVASTLEMPMQFPQQATAPTLLGKGAKQWRNGDWMCTNCNNHNYASRLQCNRCKTQRDSLSLPLSAI